MRVLFWGTPEFSLPALRALTDEGHDVVGVVTQPDRPAGRGRRPTESAVKKVAVSEMIPVLQPESVKDPGFQQRIADLAPEVSVVVAFGQILPQSLLDVPQHGSINIHASLLPELRGAAPVHWAIIHGYQETGITIMRMESGLDSGPILLQVAEPIRPDEVMSDLARQLAAVGAGALIAALALMETGRIQVRSQDHDRATYAPKVDRATAKLDWSLPAIQVARWIRGLDAVPGAWSMLRDEEPVKLFQPRVELRTGSPGEVLEVDDQVGVLIAAGHEAVRVREVQPAGKRRMDAGEWVRGRPIAVGDRFT